MTVCTLPICNRKHYAKGYCEGHYKRFKLGVNVNQPLRTEARPAKIVDGIALIPLGIGAKDGYMIVDKENSKYDKYKWSLSRRGYPIAYINGELINAHHVIVGKPTAGLVIDHINRDKLDNRKENLRFVTQQINVLNTGMLSTNTSGHKGVTFDKRSGKWVAQASFNGKNTYGGRYDNKEDAIKARKELEREHNSNLDRF